MGKDFRVPMVRQVEHQTRREQLLGDTARACDVLVFHRPRNLLGV